MNSHQRRLKLRAWRRAWLQAWKNINLMLAETLSPAAVDEAGPKDRNQGAT